MTDYMAYIYIALQILALILAVIGLVVVTACLIDSLKDR